MPYHSVSDFNLPYPAWPAPLRRIRRGAMTAFVDKASGELVAGYSYETCLFVVAISAEYPQGRLYENLTTYSVTTSAKHSWPLRQMIAKKYLDQVKSDYVEVNGRLQWVELSRTQAIAPVADAIDVPEGTRAAQLVVLCNNQPPVALLVAARKASVDAVNAAIDAGSSAYAVGVVGLCARDEALRAHRDELSCLLGDAKRAERAASGATYGCEVDKYIARQERKQAREAAERCADRQEHDARVAAQLVPTAVPAQANGLPPGLFMLDGKVYGRRI